MYRRLVYTFSDTIWIDVRILNHMTGKKEVDHAFYKQQITPQIPTPHREMEYKQNWHDE